MNDAWMPFALIQYLPSLSGPLPLDAALAVSGRAAAAAKTAKELPVSFMMEQFFPRRDQRQSEVIVVAQPVKTKFSPCGKLKQREMAKTFADREGDPRHIPIHALSTPEAMSDTTSSRAPMLLYLAQFYSNLAHSMQHLVSSAFFVHPHDAETKVPANISLSTTGNQPR